MENVVRCFKTIHYQGQASDLIGNKIIQFQNFEMLHITFIRSIMRTISGEVVSYRTSFRILPDTCGWILIKLGNFFFS